MSGWFHLHHLFFDLLSMRAMMDSNPESPSETALAKFELARVGAPVGTGRNAWISLFRWACLVDSTVFLPVTRPR